MCRFWGVDSDAYLDLYSDFLRLDQTKSIMNKNKISFYSFNQGIHDKRILCDFQCLTNFNLNAFLINLEFYSK